MIKVYFDKYRAQDKLPPEIEGKVEGELMRDQRLLERWRNWREGLIFHDTDAILSGALDDCLVERSESGDKYMPLDYKTRGWAKKEDSHEYYQYQLDAYTFLLEKNGFPTKKRAGIVFYHPIEVVGDGLVKFEIEPMMIKTDIERAYKVFREAVELLKRSTPPAKHSDCQFCGYGEHLHEYL